MAIFYGYIAGIMMLPAEPLIGLQLRRKQGCRVTQWRGGICFHDIDSGIQTLGHLED
jgi:hypothetical protein